MRYLYSADRDEPSQVQVQREESEARFRLDSGRLERSRGFGRMELRRLAEHVVAGKYSTWSVSEIRLARDRMKGRFQFRAGVRQDQLPRLPQTGRSAGFASGMVLGTVAAVTFLASGPAPNDALVMVDATDSMQAKSEQLQKRFDQLERQGVRPIIVTTHGFGVDPYGDPANLLNSLKRVQPTGGATSVYVFSDFDCETPAYDAENPDGWKQLGELVQNRHLRLFLGSVGYEPSNELQQMAAKSRGGSMPPLEGIGQTRAGGGTVRGIVRDASTGGAVPRVAVSIGPVTTMTDADGRYALTNVPFGTQDLKFSATQFLPRSSAVEVASCRLVEEDIWLPPQMEKGEVRITLNWKRDANHYPTDLDMHLIGTKGAPLDQDPFQRQVDFHLFYKTKDDLRPAAWLELDAQQPNPPAETIHLAHLPPDSYELRICDYAGDNQRTDWIALSRAVVNVFHDDGRQESFPAPPGTGRSWTVFRIDGATGTITPVNTYGTGDKWAGCISGG